MLNGLILAAALTVFSGPAAQQPVRTPASKPAQSQVQASRDTSKAKPAARRTTRRRTTAKPKAAARDSATRDTTKHD